MTTVRPRRPVVIDTDVFSADLVAGSRVAERYASTITGRPAFISFQTVAELRYGAIRRGWGRARMLKLEAKIQRVEVVHSGPELVASTHNSAPTAKPPATRSLRRCTPPIGGSPPTALRLGVPLVSNDGIFRDAPGLTLETLTSA